MTHPRCDALLPRVSRTFALPIQALPSHLQAPIQTAYLLCRLVDCVEDQANLPMSVRSRLYDAFDDALLSEGGARFQAEARRVGLGGNAAELELCHHAHEVFEDLRSLPAHQQESLRFPVLEMSGGMRVFSRRWDTRGSLWIQDVPDLERYCYFVAGTVGILLDQVFRRQADSRLPLSSRPTVAVRFGVGLQLVNILKDIAEDAERGVCFIPQALLSAHGLTAKTLLAPRHRASGRAIVSALTDLAWEHLREAARYTLSWGGPAGQPVRAFCALPLLLAAETLKLIATGEGVLTPGQNPRISRRRVAGIVSAVKVASGERRMTALLSHHGLLPGRMPWSAPAVQRQSST